MEYNEKEIVAKVVTMQTSFGHCPTVINSFKDLVRDFGKSWVDEFVKGHHLEVSDEVRQMLYEAAEDGLMKAAFTYNFKSRLNKFTDYAQVFIYDEVTDALGSFEPQGGEAA